MTINPRKPLLALAFMCLGSALPASAVTVAQGDLLVGFRATGGQGASTTYVVNIGQASTYRDATGTILVTNGAIGADLSRIYGANWSTRTDLTWGVAGVSNINGAFGGDPEDTVYASKAQTTVDVSGSAWNITSPTNLGTAASNIWSAMGIGVAGGFDEAVSIGTNPFGADEGVGDGNSWRSWMASGGASLGSSNLDFKSFSNIEGLPNQTLSLFRVSTDNGGLGTYEGYFSLSSGGNLSFVPEPTSAMLAGLGTLTLVLRRRRQA